jgi:hypothetical protein
MRLLTAIPSCAVVLGSLGEARQDPPPRQVLYNGIELPSPWPPRLSEFPTSVAKDPPTPPYLQAPPAVIPIDLGRQMWVDDFLIAESTLKRWR